MNVIAFNDVLIRKRRVLRTPATCHVPSRNMHLQCENHLCALCVSRVQKCKKDRTVQIDVILSLSNITFWRFFGLS